MTVPNKANTSKYLGTIGGRTSHGATHGTALVYQTLNGFRYDYDPESRKDRDDDIRHAVTQLVEDLRGLHDVIADYTEQYQEGVPEDIAHALVTLLSQGHDWSRDLDADYAAHLDTLDADANAELDRKETAETYDFWLHYGCEPADYRP